MFSSDSIEILIDDVIYYISSGDVAGLLAELPLVGGLILFFGVILLAFGGAAFLRLTKISLASIAGLNGKLSPRRGRNGIQHFLATGNVDYKALPPALKSIAGQMKDLKVDTVLCVDTRANAIAQAVAEVVAEEKDGHLNCRHVPLEVGEGPKSALMGKTIRVPIIAPKEHKNLVEYLASDAVGRVAIFAENYAAREQLRYVARLVETCGKPYHLTLLLSNHKDRKKEEDHFGKNLGGKVARFYGFHQPPLIWAIETPKKPLKVVFAD